MTLTVRGLDALRGLRGTTLGPSDPITVDQAMIDRFAETTGDRQWIHNDVERATRENGGTIAHGMLTLSLVVPLADRLYAVDVPVAINYGFERVRFPAPLASGSRVTSVMQLAEVQAGPRGTRASWDVTISAEGVQAPVCAARWLTFYPSLTEEETHA